MDNKKEKKQSIFETVRQVDENEKQKARRKKGGCRQKLKKEKESNIIKLLLKKG